MSALTASEFVERHQIRVKIVTIGDYNRWSPETKTMDRRRVWGLILAVLDTHGGERVLGLTHETASYVHALFLDNVLPDVVSDSQLGALSFSDFLDETVPQAPVPAGASKLWLGLNHLNEQVETWLSDNDSMRTDFYSISGES